jgi:flavin-dependent dehydrogenase
MGKTVLLVDREVFPRWKVCGCCLNGQALTVLRAADLGQLVSRCGAVPLQEIELATRKSRALLPLRGGVALSREAFDAALVRAAVEAGAAFLPGTFASIGEDRGWARSVLLRQGKRQQEGSARLVLLASGLAGLPIVAGTGVAPKIQKGSRIGAGAVAGCAPTCYRAGTIYMACGTGGYVGLVRREDGRLNLGAAFDVARIRQAGGLGKAAQMIVQEVGWEACTDFSQLSWRGTPKLTRRAANLGGRRVLVLGDAAGYVEPFTGEGMAWALTTGAAIAPLADQAIACWRPEWTQQWTALYASLVTQRQQMCRLAAQVLRYPALVRMVIAVLARAPGLAKPVLHHLDKRSGVVGASVLS